MYIYMYMYIYVYVYMKPARGPLTVFEKPSVGYLDFRNRCTIYVHLLQNQQSWISML